MSQNTPNGYELYNDRKFKEAFDALFDAAAYENDPEAQYYIGRMYRDGDGVEKNIDTAIKWWTKARRNGHRDAAFQMSEIQISTKNIF
ncbi:SEL1-like repeat protein [bacterium]|nr:SEL1-like repeat protein [bacterium]MBU1989746.1 SEL1-like repeat protein [bacterium]